MLAVSEDQNTFAWLAMDVDAVGLRTFSTSAVAAALADGYSKVFESRSGVVIRATSQDVALAASSVIAGHLAYILASC